MIYRLDPKNPPRLTKTDLARLDAMTDDDIDYSDIPELDEQFFSTAKHPPPRTGPDLIAACQASPYREIDIEPPKATAMTRQCSWEECTATTKAPVRHRWAFLQNCNGFKTGWYCYPHVQSVIAAGDGDEVDWSEWSRSLMSSDQTDDEATEYGRYAPENLPTGEDDLWHIILRLVNQSCGQKDGEEFDSWAISAYERAIMALDDAGFVEIERGGGRIYAKKLPKARNFEAWMEIHDRRDRIAEARHHLATVPGATERRGAVARLYDITLAELDDEP